MKHLPKHLQPRWRYLAIAVETWPDARISRRAFQRELWYAAQNLLGDTGSAKTDLTVIRFDFSDSTGQAIVRARRGRTDEARAILACLDSIDGDPVGVAVTGISGTVRACEEKYIGGPPESPDQRQVVFENVDCRAVDRGDRLDVSVDDSFTGATALDLR